MPRKTKAARLFLRTRDGRPSVYVIKDNGAEISTGASNADAAEKSLGLYLTEKARKQFLDIDSYAPKESHEVTCDDVLAAYIEGHVPTLLSPESVGWRVKALLPFWGAVKLSQINGQVSRRYWKYRDGKKEGTIKRELGVLQAAINYCYREGIITSAPVLVMPKVDVTEKRWLTRTEMYWLLRGARSLRPDARQQATRFIIAGRYTGSRKGVLLNTRLDMRSLTSGYIDVEQGIFYRGAINQTKSNKRKPTVRIPRQLGVFLKIWKNNGSRWLVENNGGLRLKDVKKSFESAARQAERIAAENGYNLDLTGLTPHSLRHTAVTWAMANGGDVYSISGFFGLTVEMIERVYGHHHPDHQSSALAAIEGKGR